MKEIIDENASFVLEGQEHFVGDRVRLKENKNNTRATALCEIKKIKSDKDILVWCVMNDAKIAVSVDELTLM